MATITDIIEKNAAVAQYDENAKALLARKAFLANILVRTVKEFWGMSPRLVETLIEGEPQISSVPVEEGFTNSQENDGNTIITGMNAESKVSYEGVLFFDVIFFVRSPRGRKKIIINMEAQKNYPTKYHVENRGIMYCARSISAQMEREVKNQKYDKMQKVYSIWICMNCKENLAYHIHMTKEDIVGRKIVNHDYDLVNVIVIELSQTLASAGDTELHRLLGAMFLDFDVKEKLRILEREFDIDINTEGRREVGEMCNLGEGIYERGIECGIERGIEQTRTQMIISMQELGLPIEQIAKIARITIAEVMEILEKRGNN